MLLLKIMLKITKQTVIQSDIKLLIVEVDDIKFGAGVGLILLERNTCVFHFT